MKKINFIIMALSLVFAVGCSKDNGLMPEGAKLVNAEFSIAVDDNGSKAISYVGGDGNSVNRCLVQIWMKVRNEWKFYSAPSVTKTDNKHYKFSQDFAENQKFQILVWIDKEGYYDFKTTGINDIDDAAAVLKADKRNLNQTDDLDAFFATKEYVASSQLNGTSATIVAKRPFAQLNVIATDYNKLISSYIPETISISYNAPVSFNLLKEALGSSQAFGDEQKIDIRNVRVLQSDVQAESNILSMDYIFARSSESLKTFSYTIHYGEDIQKTFTNIPIIRNWRTNIIGPLVTVSNDFKVVVDPGWTGDMNIN